MNPFRRIVPREIGLYLTALVLLVQMLSGAAHTGHAVAHAHAAICAADHEPAPALAPAPTCPLCQLPALTGPVPPPIGLAAPIAWLGLVPMAAGDAIVASIQLDLPPVRGPPISV
jgi:hypothetical protein